MAREPLYKKAEAEMLRRIRSGKWPEGTRLGNEFEPVSYTHLTLPTILRV